MFDVHAQWPHVRLHFNLESLPLIKKALEWEWKEEIEDQALKVALVVHTQATVWVRRDAAALWVGNDRFLTCKNHWIWLCILCWCAALWPCPASPRHSLHDSTLHPGASETASLFPLSLIGFISVIIWGCFFSGPLWGRSLKALWWQVLCCVWIIFRVKGKRNLEKTPASKTHDKQRVPGGVFYFQLTATLIPSLI